MSHDQAVHQLPPQALVKRNRFFGVVIILIVATPMLLAYIMFHTGWGVSGLTTNKGELLQPATSIKELNLDNTQSLFQTIFKADELSDSTVSKKWRLLIPVSNDCSKLCEDYLYTTRQVHIRLAEKAYRVERVIVSLDSLSREQQQFLTQQHPNTLLFSSNHQQFNQWLAETNGSKNPADYYYLVDQEGFAMMRYNRSHSGQDLLDDVKKVLKFTYDK